MVIAVRQVNMGKIGSFRAFILREKIFTFCNSIFFKSDKLFGEKVLRNCLIKGLVLKN